MCFAVEAFDVACGEIYKLLKTDSYRRFSRTSEFKVAVKHIELTKKNARLIRQINHNAQLKSINNNIKAISTATTVNKTRTFNHTPKKIIHRITDFDSLATATQPAANHNPTVVININNIAFSSNNMKSGAIGLQSNSATPRVGGGDENDIDLDINLVVPGTPFDSVESIVDSLGTPKSNTDNNISYIPLKLSNNGPSKASYEVTVKKPQLSEDTTRESIRL